MDEGGTVQAMLADTPQLRTVADGVFYFQDPERLGAEPLDRNPPERAGTRLNL